MASDYDYQLAQILNQRQREDYQNDPWIAGGQALLQGSNSMQGSGWGNIAARSLANFLGGAATGYGKESIRSEYTDPQSGYMTQLSTILNTPSDERGALLASDTYSGLNKKIGDVLPILSVLEKGQKEQERKELQGMINKATLENTLKNPYGPKAEFEITEDGKVKVKNAEPQVFSPRKEDNEEPGYARPNKRLTLDEATEQAALEARRLGISAGDTAEFIAKKTKPLLDERTRAEKDLEERAQRAAEMERIAREAEQGIAQAGNTGGILGGVRRIGDQIMSAVGNEDATQKMAGDTILDRVSQAGVGLNRVKGAGALSDFESKALYSSFISKNKTPAENKALLDELSKNATIENEYNGFMRSYLDQFGHVKGAQAAWEGYKKMQPIVTVDNKGKSTINMDRKPWQAYDFEELESIGKGQDLAAKAIAPTEAQVIPGSDLVTIRNKKTGEIRQVPRSQLGR